MNLIVDIGNTCVKLVCFDDGEVIEEKRVDGNDVEALSRFCSKYPFSKGIVSSVSSVSDSFMEKLKGLPFRVLEFESGVTPVPVSIGYNTPLTLGTDRLAAVVGANDCSPGKDILVIDIGTCVTYDLISSSAEHLGGNISPGPTMRLKALHEYTSRLPLVERRGEAPLVGYSTETAIRSGVLHGIEYEINGYIHRFLTKYPHLFVYLTGGVQLDLHFSEKITIFADRFIVPKGLNRILEYNDEINK